MSSEPLLPALPKGAEPLDRDIDLDIEAALRHNFFVSLLAKAKAQVLASVLYRTFIDGTPLENDIAVWMATFASEGMRPVVAEVERLCAENVVLVDTLVQCRQVLAEDMTYEPSDAPLRSPTRQILPIASEVYAAISELRAARLHAKSQDQRIAELEAELRMYKPNPCADTGGTS